MDLNRLYRVNEKVYVFANHFNNGLPRIVKGVVVGVVKQPQGIYNFQYIVEAENNTFYRFPDAIFKSVEEIADEIKNYVVE